MKISILGSSSSGNSTFVEIGNHKILIDVGFSLKKLEEKLNSIDVSISDIDTVFITHEHIDHVRCLSSIMRKCDVTVYMHKDSFEVFSQKNSFNIDKIKFLEEKITFLENCYVTNFDLNHDAMHCLGFTFHENDKKFVYITDTGHLSKIAQYTCLDANVLAIESNYDLNMLMSGKYPWDIKSRIKSKNGHLSNDDALNLIKKLDIDKLQKVYLMHISEQNNTPELAFKNISENFPELDIEISGEEATKIYNL